MRLIPDSGTLVMRGNAQWKRCAFDDTVLADGVVTLQSQPSSSAEPDVGGNFSGGFAGLSFDPHCRLFHPQPEDGRLEYVLWGQTSTLGVHATAPNPFVITAAGTEVDGGATGALPQRPLSLACDESGFLYIADPDSKAVWLIDTWQQEVSRRIPFEQAPVDLAACGAEIFALLADGSTWLLAPCAAPLRMPWPAVADAARLTIAPAANGGRLAWVLQRAGQFDAALHALHLDKSLGAPFVTDIASEAEHPEFGALLTLAQRPGEAFLRMRLAANQPTPLPPLLAPHYDGRGIALAPDDRIAYWTAQGLRHAIPARMHYLPEGRVFCYALDSGHDQCQWGRIVVEACIPPGTQIHFRAFSRDEADPDDPLCDFSHGQNYPLLARDTWDNYAGDSQSLFRDTSQRPLSPAPAEGFALYDAPVRVEPGRYLWLAFELSGTRSKSPRLRAARVEYPGHDLLGKLPRTLWREPASRDFLFRYLMPIAAILDEWESVAANRQRLLDARIAPGAALPWLAGFIGLALDPCWPEAVQRQMIIAAASLFRTRGTLPSLRRMVEILTGSEVIIIEHFRLRGGGVAGNDQVNASQAVLGVGYRVGGMIGEVESRPLADAPARPHPNLPPQAREGANESLREFNADDDFAHRFTVTVVAALGNAQLACVRRLIEHHKPAHTDFTLCTAASGIRAGLGAHVGISSVVGKSVGFETALMGDAVLGAGYLLGRPALEDMTSVTPDSEAFHGHTPHLNPLPPAGEEANERYAYSILSEGAG